MKFNELEIIPEILKALEEQGYESPSEIQEQAIPPLLLGKDLLGCAQTGTGKTAAFAIPILQLLTQDEQNSENKTKKRTIKALILTPTRELAIQINESFKDYGKYLNQKSAVIFGGVSQKAQVDQLQKGVDILIATPGRLNDLINQGYVDISKVCKFVLDEADRMLDMGFINDVKKIINEMHIKRQTLLFSATMPNEIIGFVNSLLVNPVKIAITPVSSTVDVINQSVYMVDKINKQKLMNELLLNKEITSALVFTRTKHGADKVVKELAKVKVLALAIHGNKSQNARQSALASFKSGEIRVLVATDIAARGIDIDSLSHVINFDLPNIPETYVHRIGRTGRAGLEGTAISFCDFDEKEYLDDIEKLINKSVPVVKEHNFPMKIFEATPKKQPTPRNSSNNSADNQGTAKKDKPYSKNYKSKSSSSKNFKAKSATSNKFAGKPVIRSLNKKTATKASGQNSKKGYSRKP